MQDNKRLIERFLLEQYEAGRHPILLIDEAQNVHPDNIDVLSDLSNFQTAEDKLITIVMLAQDNFPNKLSPQGGVPLADRRHQQPRPALLRGHEGHDRPPDHRRRAAESLAKYFTDKALIEIYNTTQGIPRDVCVLCDAAFVNAFVRAEKTVTPEIVAQTLCGDARGQGLAGEIQRHARKGSRSPSR